MIGNVGHEVPCWVRASAFLDYGQIHDLGPVPAGAPQNENFCGLGFGFSANIGSHIDGRLTVAWPMIVHPGESDSARVYFGIGGQF